ncbi:MAG: hypothetical protein EAZ97_12930 [Bacteroidetes bacterium]|nr:MAG: hypothetical protein EAZ97_12930 [Bacteroidota bacterium]
MYLKIFLAIFIIIISQKTFAQKYYFRTFGLDEGLTQISINDLIQDRIGNIWVSTGSGGVCRFNGKKFFAYDVNNGLVDNEPRALLQDSKDNIWIVTGKGISVHDGQKFTNYKQKDGFPEGISFQIIEDENKRIWIYNRKNLNQSHLFYFENGKFIDIVNEYPNFFKNNFIGGIKPKASGGFLIFTNNGIYDYDGKIFSFSKINQAFENTDFVAQKAANSLAQSMKYAFEHSKNQYWIGELTPTAQFRFEISNIFSYRSDDPKIIPVPLPKNIVLGKIFKDSKGNLVCTSNQGFLIHKGNYYQEFSRTVGNFTNDVHKILEDREGNLWLGVIAGGLWKYGDGRFISFDADSGIESIMTFGLYEDPKGIWFGQAIIGEKKNLTLFDGKKVETVASVSGDIHAINSYKNGLMLATRNGLYSFKDKKIKQIQTELGIEKANDFRDIYKDDSSYWFATDSYIYKYDGKITTQIKDSTFSNFAFDIFKDSKSNFWFGTQKGLVLYQNNKISRIFLKKDGLSDDRVRQIAEDKLGRIWIATGAGGVNIFDGKNFTYLGKKEGLHSNSIYSIIQDNQGDMWLGTQAGIERIRLDKKGKIINIRNYDKNDGFHAIEANSRSVLKDSKGNLWFGSIKGVFKFDFENDRLDAPMPTTQIVKLKLFYKPVNWIDSVYQKYHQGLEDWTQVPQKLSLPYEENHLTFQFEALLYQVPEHLEYQWKLEGSDKDWSVISTQTEATYPNLAAGNYRFLVKSRNIYGQWNKEPTVLEFEILPPFWQTWWFILFVLIFLLGLGYGLARWQTQQKIKTYKIKEQKLEILVQERTAEINKQAEELSQNNEFLNRANIQIQKKNEDITASINYAQRIQSAILPFQEDIADSLGADRFFILFKPRDIVSGDFYWFETIENQHIIAVADCTGHGVPGAFMSMIGNQILNEIILQKNIFSPEKILFFLHREIRRTLKQSENSSKDGMDISILILQENAEIIGENNRPKIVKAMYSGAMNPLYYVQNQEFIEIKATKRSIGGQQSEEQRIFELHEIQTLLPTCFYLCTDGYQDQFGGDKNKKFMVGHLKKLLFSIADKEMITQENILNQSITNWMQLGNEDQIDDITIMGLKV